MTVKQIFDLAIKEGIGNDFRDQKTINEHLKIAKELFNKLPATKKALFDKERITNPYSDSRIHFDAGQKEIKKVLVGIDITTGELLMAKQLGVDLVIGHHPSGSALQGLDDAMKLQADVLELYGVPINVAEGCLTKRISEVARGVHASNSFITVDAARNLNMSFMNIHTPADNAVSMFVKEKIEKSNPRYVSEILDLLYTIPEYQEAVRRGSAPTLYAGAEKNRAGKIAVTEMTGGTEGAPEIYEKMATAGIGTVIAMHQSEKHREAAEKAHINVVVAPHIASDSLGMNLVLAKILAKGTEMLSAGGFIWVKR